MRDSARPRRLRAGGVVALVALLAAGCSFSYSSGSISDSIESSSKSSSDSSESSSGGGSQSAYRQDVRDYTYAYLRSSQDVSGLTRGVGDVARRHGISSWETDADTWRGIGEGLARAGVSPGELDAYKRTLSGSEGHRMAEIQDGYESQRRS